MSTITTSILPLSKLDLSNLATPDSVIESAVPCSIREKEFTQSLIPTLAKSPNDIKEIDSAIRRLPTKHRVICHDSTKATFLAPQSVHLIVTSPPYWTLKEYNHTDGQLGDISDYDEFLALLDKVWKHCYRALVPGGRVVCVVGDVCLSRRKNGGRHTVVPLHASIQEHCRKIGFDNVAPIIWYKIANAAYESDGGGAGFLGKPYEPNAVIKNDIEFILMERKPGGYRKPSTSQKLLSLIAEDRYSKWFRQIWTDVPGASTRDHPAPYPVDLAERLIRMFSFVGDVVLDPFAGTGSTLIAAANSGRNSIGIELDPDYTRYAADRICTACTDLYTAPEIMVYE